MGCLMWRGRAPLQSGEPSDVERLDGVADGLIVAALRPGIEGGEGGEVNGQGADKGVRQAEIDRTPAAPPIDALEHAAVKRSGIEGGGRGAGINRQGGDIEVEQAEIDRTPAAPPID